MADFNINAGYGRLLATALHNNPTGGRVFMVAPTSHPNYAMIQEIFQPDALGNARLFTTLAAAVSGITAAEGDIVFIAEGHAETFSTSTAITLSTSGVKFIGLGTGALRPTFTLDTATSARINVSASNIQISNCIFVANFAAIVTCFNLTTAADFQVINCEFRDTDASHNFLALVTTAATSNAADGFLMSGCKYSGLATTGAVRLATVAGTNDRWTIQNNYFASLTTGTGAVIPIATGKVLTNFLLLNNRFNLQNATGTATAYLVTTDGSTNSGFIDGNMDHSLPTTPLLITASSGFVYGANYHSDQADLQGYLVPGADV